MRYYSVSANYDSLSATAAVGASEDSQLGRLHCHGKIVNLRECIRDDAVVRPATVLPIGDESRLFQNSQMKREPGLRRIEAILQVAHTLLAVPQLLEDAESSFVGQRMKELCGAW